MKKLSIASLLSKKTTSRNERNARSERVRARALRLESLESRELLSVAPGSEFLAADNANIHGCISGPFTVGETRAAYEASAATSDANVVDLTETMLAAETATVDTQQTVEASQAATPTVWVVDTTADTVTSDAMSLRKAIQNALGGDVIEFSPSLNGATISVTAPLSVTRSSLTIDASALSDGVTLDGGGQYRIMEVSSTVNNLTITGVDFKNGYTSNENGYDWNPGGAAIFFYGESLHLRDCSFSNNEAHSYSTMRGGAIHVSNGVLLAESCEFKNNKLIDEFGCPFDGGGAIGGESASLVSVYNCYFQGNSTNRSGGAIRSCGEVIVDSSVFIGNEASADGGALYCDDANLSVEGSTFTGNSAYDGGAIASCEGEHKNGFLTVKDSSFIQNTAIAGGAIAADSSLIENSRISGNTANLGAGVFLGLTYGSSGSNSLINLTLADNVASHYGGAVYNVGAISTLIENSLIARNTATLGGGLYLEGGETTLLSSTITKNICSDRGGGIWLSDGGVLNVVNSIVAVNTAPQGADVMQYGSQSAARNVLSGYAAWNSGANQLTYNANQPLFTNAGFGDYSLPAGSQAVNRGDNARVSTQTDIIGKTRIIGGTVDLGAYEYSATSPTTLEAPTITSSSTTHNSITLNWNATSNASGYVVAYRKFSDSTYAVLSATTSTSFTIDGLDAETTYYVKVYAQGDRTNYTDSDYGAVKSVVTQSVPTEKLAAPTIASTSTTTNSVTVKWDAIENALGYVVAYKKSTDSDYTVVSSTTATTRTILNLSANTTYNVKVYAEGDGTNYANSDYSAVKTVKTLPANNVETPSLTVTTDEDVVDVYDGKISLREALTLYSSDGDTILFASSMKGKTITLVPENGQLEASKNITIDASNLYTSSTATPGVTISGGDATRIMQLASGNTATIKGLAFTRGKSFGNGGAILNNGALTIQNCVFTDNDSNVTHEDESIDWYVGGAIAVSNGASINADGCLFSGNNGSGVISIQTDASSAFTNCQIVDNPTYGVYFYYGSASQVTFENVVFTGNEEGVYFSSDNDSVVFSNCVLASSRYGLYLSSDKVTVSLFNCELSSNTYGIYAFSGSLSIDNSRISNNHVGLYSFRAKTNASNIVVDKNTNDGGWGGGIYLNGGEITLRNATITNNYARYGGGVFVQVASAVLNVYNSIIVGNTASYSGDDVYKSNASSSVNAWNVLSSYTEWSSGSNQLTHDATQPLFTDAESGDYTLAEDSQAIDKGNNEYATTSVDLAGNARVSGAAVDLGAYEYQPTPSYVQLDAPTNARETSKAETTITVAWNAVANATGYRIAWKNQTASAYSYITVGATTSCRLTGLDNGATYEWKVQALGDGVDYVDSEYTAPRSIAPRRKLATPVVSYAPEQTSITVSWNAVPNASSYRVMYKPTGGSFKTISVVASKTSYTIAGLTPGETYSIKVAALGDGSNYSTSDYSTLTDVTTLGSTPTPDPIQLDAPVLAVTAKTETTITLSWNAVENASGYRLALRNQSDPAFSYLEISAEATSYKLTGLDNAATYYWKVLALGDGVDYSDSDYSTVVDGKPRQKLAAPTNARTTDTAPTSVTVAWDAVPNALRYSLSYKLATESTWTNKNVGTNLSYTINGLEPNVQYNMRVRAIGDAFDYSSSDYAAITFAPGPNPILLDAPDLTVDAAPTSMTLSWDSVPNAVSYRIYYRRDDETSWRVFNAGTNLSYTITGLEPNTQYRVRAKTFGDNVEFVDSNFSPTISVATPGYDPIQLDAPVPTVTAKTATSITAAWSEVPNAAGYRFIWKNQSDASYTVELLGATTTSQTLAGLDNSAVYVWKVLALGDNVAYLNSEYCATQRDKPQQTLPAPTLTVAAATDSLTPSWNVVSNAVRYSVSYKSASDSTWKNVNVGANLSYTIEGLDTNAEYDVRIRSIGDGIDYKNSGYSATVRAATESTVIQLDAPVVTVDAAQTSLTVSWSDVPNADRFSVSYKLASETTWKNVNAGTNLSYTINGLESNTEYDVRVKAVGDGVSYKSSYSEIVRAKTIATTRLDAPANPRATAKTATSITAAWDAVPNATGYRFIWKNQSDPSYTVELLGAATTSHTFDGLDNAAIYVWKVLALGDNVAYLNSEYCATQRDKPQQTLAAPTLTVAAATDSLTLSWNAVANAVRYSVSYKRANGTTWTNKNVGATLSCTLEELEQNTEYDVRVRTVGDGVNYKNSGYSATVRAKTEASVIQLDSPTVTVAAAQTSLTVSWDAVPNADRYSVSYKLATESTWTNKNVGTNLSYTISGLDADTEYDVRVKAIGDGTNYKSAYSAIIRAKTETAPTPDEPTQLAAPVPSVAAKTATSITATWNAVPNAIG